MTYLANPLIRWGLYGIAVVAAVVAFLSWLHSRENAAVEADRTAASVDGLTTARKADDASGEAVRAEHAATRQRIEQAREAAAAGEDPLADGLRGLR